MRQLALCLLTSCALSTACSGAPIRPDASGGPVVLQPASAANDGYVLIPAGSYQQGGNDIDNQPRQVRISRPFYMKTTEVTQAEWQSVMGSNPSDFKGCANCPVENVSWNDAVAYMNKLSEREGLEKCYRGDGAFVGLQCRGYRLPTEAEWEYAARAGTTGDYYGDLDAIAWYSHNSDSSTRPVGQKGPNAWGLYDMLGNVWEWTNDWYTGAYGSDVTDPLGPNTGFYRVLRGGGWDYIAEILVVSIRVSFVPGDRYNGLGFRPSRSGP